MRDLQFNEALVGNPPSLVRVVKLGRTGVTFVYPRHAAAADDGGGRCFEYFRTGARRGSFLVTASQFAPYLSSSSKTTATLPDLPLAISA